MEWLGLVEYSNKYGVSVSTLRRRIRSNTLKCKSDSGRYLVPDIPFKDVIQLSAEKESDQPKKRAKRGRTPLKPSNGLAMLNFDGSLAEETFESVSEQVAGGYAGRALPTFAVETKPQNTSASKMKAISGNHLTEKLFEEVRAAYGTILKEKEEQIFMLREEIVDLKTLIRVLESELKAR
ncbi:MAG: hypothetical protein COT74_03985 [Bdellovibrionales bacterium CG10_big_fil_rev_8_21_14_0_10_45_34]|nr:MAG: hypothetical protein COT74_03985 [Bdellovibrionales bacterium CG10_big_fil_rev_8_21_14_0_10_45_34]